MTAADDGRLAFCARCLVDGGVRAADVERLAASYRGGWELVRGREGGFFAGAAEGLRDLWPQGLKDGKWPWRDSAANVEARLRTLWRLRGLDRGGYTVDDVLACARAYVAGFEGDRKYMKLLKYWILKTADRGGVRLVESQLADSLEAAGHAAASLAAAGGSEALGAW